MQPDACLTSIPCRLSGVLDTWMFGNLYLGCWPTYVPNDTAAMQTADPRAGDVASLAVFAKVLLVWLLRAGMAEVSAAASLGTAATDLALLHQLVGLAAASLAYCLVGHALAHGQAGGRWAPSTPRQWQRAADGWSAAASSTAVLGAAAAGRLHLVGNAAAAALHAGIVLPVLERWVRPAVAPTFVDLGGGVAVHASGGALALIAALFLGRRLVLARELEPSSSSWRRPGLGHALVAVGAAALCLPGGGAAAAVCSTLAALGAVLAAVLLAALVHDEWRPYWSVLGVLQAAIAGVVTASSGADVYSPWVALLVGAIGGTVSTELSRLLFRTALEDPAGLLPSFLACGVVSGLLPPLLGSGLAPGTDLFQQALGVAAFLAAVAATATPLFLALRCAGFLRTRAAQMQHRRASAPPYRDTAFFRRLYPPRERLMPGERYEDEDLGGSGL